MPPSTSSSVLPTEPVTNSEPVKSKKAVWFSERRALSKLSKERSSQSTTYKFQNRSASVTEVTQIAKLWGLAQTLSQEPLTTFFKVMLFHEDVQLDFCSPTGKILVRYRNLLYRYLAVKDYLTRLEQVPVKDICAQTGMSLKAVCGRLDKIRDAFQVYLTGGTSLTDRAVAFKVLREAGWHDEDCAAVLRTSLPRLRHYSQIAPVQGKEFVREKVARS